MLSLWKYDFLAVPTAGRTVQYALRLPAFVFVFAASYLTSVVLRRIPVVRQIVSIG